VTQWPFYWNQPSSLNLTTGANAGQRNNMVLVSDTFTYDCPVLVSATVQFAVNPVTAIRGNGSVLQAFDYTVFDEQGDLILPQVPPQLVRQLNEAGAQSALPASRLSSVAVGTYQISELFLIPFAFPDMRMPQETAFRDKKADGKVQIGIQLSANWLQNLVNPGTSTVTMTNITVTAMQRHNPSQTTMPWFRPRYTFPTANVAASGQQAPIVIGSNMWCAGLLLAQLGQLAAGQMYVTDILNSFRFQSDQVRYLPDFLPLTMVQQLAQYTQGGAVDVTGFASFYFHNFRNHGRLSTMTPPNMSNYQVIPNAQPSVTAGVTSSMIQILLVNMERIGVVSGNRIVTNPAPLPF
jgi:hypothetical protein